jgi:hypothetical protein
MLIGIPCHLDIEGLSIHSSVLSLILFVSASSESLSRMLMFSEPVVTSTSSALDVGQVQVF